MQREINLLRKENTKIAQKLEAERLDILNSLEACLNEL